MALKIYLEYIVGRGAKLDDFFVQEKLRDKVKEKERTVNGINCFVQRTTRNDIFRNPTFIKTRNKKIGTHSIRKYATTRARRSGCSRSEASAWVRRKE